MRTGFVGKAKLWRAIKEKCLDCCAGNRGEVRSCPVEGCPLWRFRLGARGYAKAAEKDKAKAAS